MTEHATTPVSVLAEVFEKLAPLVPGKTTREEVWVHYLSVYSLVQSCNTSDDLFCTCWLKWASLKKVTKRERDSVS